MSYQGTTNLQHMYTSNLKHHSELLELQVQYRGLFQLHQYRFPHFLVYVQSQSQQFMLLGQLFYLQQAQCSQVLYLCEQFCFCAGIKVLVQFQVPEA